MEVARRRPLRRAALARAPSLLVGCLGVRGVETEPPSLRVMTDEQFLQRILRILPRTLSSAIE